MSSSPHRLLHSCIVLRTGPSHRCLIVRPAGRALPGRTRPPFGRSRKYSGVGGRCGDVGGRLRRPLPHGPPSCPEPTAPPRPHHPAHAGDVVNPRIGMARSKTAAPRHLGLRPRLLHSCLVLRTGPSHQCLSVRAAARTLISWCRTGWYVVSSRTRPVGRVRPWHQSRHPHRL